MRDPNPIVTSEGGPRTSHYIWDIVTGGAPVFEDPEAERQNERAAISRNYTREQQAKNAAAAELSATSAAHAEERAKLREEATQSAAASATEAERAVRAALGNELEQATTAAAADATSNLNAQRERHERELAEAKAQVAAVAAARRRSWTPHERRRSRR